MFKAWGLVVCLQIGLKECLDPEVPNTELRWSLLGASGGTEAFTITALGLCIHDEMPVDKPGQSVLLKTFNQLQQKMASLSFYLPYGETVYACFVSSDQDLPVLLINHLCNTGRSNKIEKPLLQPEINASQVNTAVATYSLVIGLWKFRLRWLWDEVSPHNKDLYHFILTCVEKA